MSVIPEFWMVTAGAKSTGAFLAMGAVLAKKTHLNGLRGGQTTADLHDILFSVLIDLMLR